MSTREDREKRPKKESILDLSRYVDKQIHVKFAGGREVLGSLKGFDGLMNLVLDEAKEPLKSSQETDTESLGVVRDLGLIVVRGPQIVAISPTDGTEEIANPFLQVE